MMTLSEELEWRGFVNQTTFTSLKDLDSRTWTFYHGFDASADSQTVGNLAAMMFDRAFMRHGHKAIILAGGATSLIGDPGGKDAERQLQGEESIARNVEWAKQQLSTVFHGHEFVMVNNLDWTKNMTVIEFLRDIGKHFSMTPLVQRDYIAKRLGEGGAGISYAEFSYTILQGMDFLHLFDEFGCSLQLGGADQWGNCLSGVELIRRARGKEAHVITLALIINKATGKKFGKSEDGAVWLDPEKTSPYKFYQFWLNSEDDAVESYLKIFTELDKPAVDQLMGDFNVDRTGRVAQKTLAHEVTKLVHGEDKANAVQKVTDVLFGAGDFNELEVSDLDILRSELPVVHVDDNAFIASIVQAGLASSNSDVNRLLASGAFSVNGVKLSSAQDVRLKPGVNLVKRGKNSFAILEH